LQPTVNKQKMKILTFNKAGDPADVVNFTEKQKPAPGDNEPDPTGRYAVH